MLRTIPQVFDALHLLGLVYEQQGKLFDASALVRTAIRVSPSSAAALGNYANILNKLGRHDEAAISSELSLKNDPGNFVAHTNLGNARAAQGRHFSAIEHYSAALQTDPGHPKATANLASALLSSGDPERAVQVYRAGLDRCPDDPELNFGLAAQLLRDGFYLEGFRRYEHRWNLKRMAPSLHPPIQTAWIGAENLAGRTILLRAEQGMGDTVQFARYIPLVAAMAATVYVEIQPTLVELLVHNYGHLAKFVQQGEPLPLVDFECPLLSLPLALGTTLQTIPAGGRAYLRPLPSRSATWSARLPEGRGPRVGFVWSANRLSGLDARNSSKHRSVSLALFAELMRLPGQLPVCLQREMSKEEGTAIAGMPFVANLGPLLVDFADTASVVAELDIVVTVDTAVAHVAGALGKPVWILIPAIADWRWLRHRDDTPWYTSAKLYRQSEPGSWEAPIHDVATELAGWISRWQLGQNARDLVVPEDGPMVVSANP